MWWDGIASTQGSKTRCRNKLQTERSRIGLLSVCNMLWRQGHGETGRYHAFRFTINATDCVLVAEEDHRRGPMSCYLNRPVIVSTVAGP